MTTRRLFLRALAAIGLVSVATSRTSRADLIDPIQDPPEPPTHFFQWFEQADVPSPDYGEDGDIWRDTRTGFLYRHEFGEWVGPLTQPPWA